MCGLHPHEGCNPEGSQTEDKKGSAIREIKGCVTF